MNATKTISNAEKNCELGTSEAARKGHNLSGWTKHRAHLYSAYCGDCGANLSADAHEVRGSAINSLTCEETQRIGARIRAEMDAGNTDEAAAIYTDARARS